MRKYSILIGLLMAGLLGGCGIMESAELLTSEIGETQMQEIDAEETAASNAEEAESEQSEGSMWNFSHRLFSENIGETNPVLSPVSAYLAMGMVGLGADGDTLTEFQNVMGADLHETSQGLMQNLPKGAVSEEESSETVLTLANSVWVDDIMEPEQSWLDDVSAGYAAEAYRAELSADSTMRRINSWIKDKTNGMIDSLLNKPLEEDTCLALFNTIYFYGQWQSTFSPESTAEDTFTKEDGTTVTVDMMRKSRSNLYYVQQEAFDGVVLPYRDGDTAFVALKPTAGQSVREMFGELTEEQFSELLTVEDTTYVNLKLPKFEVTFDKVLNESLQNMGIVSAFNSNTADFSKLGSAQGEPLFVSLVRQKAVVRVDEKGTEAAAVTAVMQYATSAMPPQEQPLEVYFDEPFLYMIVDRKQEVPLFVGIMDCPE